jgi:phosphate transport system substrate-binding protein
MGLGGKGNEGVTGIVKSTPGSLGYVELIYAIQQKLPMAQIKNKEGTWSTPSLEATSAAAAGVQMPDDFRVSITDPSGKDAYPISGFTYLLVHRDAKDKAKGTAIINFLRWAVTDGQAMTKQLDYAPLPKPVQEKVLKTIDTLTVQGTKLSAK